MSKSRNAVMANMMRARREREVSISTTHTQRLTRVNFPVQRHTLIVGYAGWRRYDKVRQSVRAKQSKAIMDQSQAWNSFDLGL